MRKTRKATKFLLALSLIFCLGIGDQRRSVEEIERQLDDLIEQLKKVKKMGRIEKTALITIAAYFGTQVVFEICWERNLCGWRTIDEEFRECMKDPNRKIADCLECLDEYQRRR